MYFRGDGGSSMDVCIEVLTAGFLTTRTGSVAAGQQCAQSRTLGGCQSYLQSCQPSRDGRRSREGGRCTLAAIVMNDRSALEITI